MAGIFAIYKKKELSQSLKKELEALAFKIKNRGKLNTIKYESSKVFLIFHGNNKKNNIISNNCQIDENDGTFVAIDGQIYNFRQIYDQFCNISKENIETSSELNLLFNWFKMKGKFALEKLYGFFSGIIFDGKELIGFKDPIGSKPLYYCNTKEFFALSSELKVLSALETDIKPVLPANIVYSSGSFDRYYKYPEFSYYDKITSRDTNEIALKLNELVKSVIKESVNPEENTCALLSGGLDSVIISHVANTCIKDLMVYTVGTKNSKDVYYAKQFAELYKLKHNIIDFNLEEMIDILPDVIYALETFDAALIRSSIPMFIVSKVVKSENNIDVLLTGEGGDELFGGYEYLTKFDNIKALNQEFINLLEIEHKTGLQRVDRIPYNFSIEARAPLFDRRLVEFSFTIPHQLKIYKKDGVGVAEKWILRKAFENEIPTQFIWRKKQKFSDGAGSQFLVREYVETIITDDEFNSEKQITPFFSLRSKEELYYWKIFKDLFKPTENTIKEIGITATFEI